MAPFFHHYVVILRFSAFCPLFRRLRKEKKKPWKPSVSKALLAQQEGFEPSDGF